MNERSRGSQLLAGTTTVPVRGSAGPGDSRQFDCATGAEQGLDEPIPELRRKKRGLLRPRLVQNAPDVTRAIVPGRFVTGLTPPIEAREGHGRSMCGQDTGPESGDAVPA